MIAIPEIDRVPLSFDDFGQWATRLLELASRTSCMEYILFSSLIRPYGVTIAI